MIDEVSSLVACEFRLEGSVRRTDPAERPISGANRASQGYILRAYFASVSRLTRESICRLLQQRDCINSIGLVEKI